MSANRTCCVCKSLLPIAYLKKLGKTTDYACNDRYACRERLHERIR